MATTSGFVISLTWVGNLVCSQIGVPGQRSWLIVQFNSDDPSDVLLLKRSIVKALVRAKHAGYPVTATHGDADALIDEHSVQRLRHLSVACRHQRLLHRVQR